MLSAARGGITRHRLAAVVQGVVRITRSGTTLMRGGSPFRFAGANMYWLGVDDNGGARYPTHAMIDDGLSQAQSLGITVVRAHTLGISLPGYPDTALSLLTSTGTYNDAAFEPIDYAFQKAASMGIYLIIPLVDQWRYYHGGRWNFVHLRAGQSSQFVGPSLPTTVTSTGTIVDTLNNAQNNPVSAAQSSPEQDAEDQFHSSLLIRSDFKAYIAHIFNHVNQYTGNALGTDPIVLAWETGNEIYHATQEWTQSIATYIKSLSPNVLVADGSAADGLATTNGPGVSCSAIDIVGGHYYPSPGTSLVSARGSQLSADASAAASAGKVFWVGEYPWANTTAASDLTPWLTQIEQTSSIAGAAFWSLIAHGDTHGSGEGTNDASLFYPGTSTQMTNSISSLTTFASVMAGSPVAPTSFTTASAPNGSVGSAYSYQFSASGYPVPTYSVASGSLPAGLSLATNGLLSGTPTTAASNTFTVRATNTAGSFTSSTQTVGIFTGATNLMQSVAVANTTAPVANYTLGGATGSLSLSTSQTSLAASTLRAAISASGYPYVYPNAPTTAGAPVTAGATYTGWIEAEIGGGNSGLVGGTIQVSWYDASGAYLSNASGSYAALSSSSATVLSCTVVAPTSAAFAVPQFNGGQQAVSGDLLYLGHLGIFAGNKPTAWSSP